MKLKKISLLVFFLLGLFMIGFSASLEKGFKYLDKGKKDKARVVFQKYYNEDQSNIMANYGLFLLYKEQKAEKAYPYLLRAQKGFKTKKVASAGDVMITPAKIEREREKIEKTILQYTLRQNDLSTVLYFIKKYPDAHNIESAKIRRNELAFQKARKEHSIKGYNQFLQKYEEAEQRTEVENLRNDLIFVAVKDSNTIEAYERFLEKYPTSKEVYRATKNRNALVFKKTLEKNTVQALQEFIEKYPDADQVAQAKQLRNDRAHIELLNTEKKLQQKEIEAEKERLEKNQLALEHEEKKAQVYTILFVGVGILLIIVIIAFVGQKRAKNKIEKQKEVIESSRAEILKKNEEITQKNQEILDSINYAKFIQTAILPSTKRIKNHFKDAFIFYRPKDIVSGDFYWYGEVGEKQIIAAVDCTGHGVPGAFMSMIGNTLLNQIVLREQITNPAEILFKLRQEVIKALAQSHIEDDSEDTRKDGMDIALCVIEGNKVEFSGAFNPVILVKNGEATQVKADRMPIGDYLDKNNTPFTNHEYIVENGDTIYLFSDGYPDQFGGDKDKKMGSKAFRETLASIAHKSADEQGKILKQKIDEWMGETPQIDDMLIVGVKF